MAHVRRVGTPEWKQKVKGLPLTKDLKEVKIGPLPHQVTKLGILLSEYEKKDLIILFKRNVDMFAWTPSNMLGMDTRVMCHRLAINVMVKLVSQRKCKADEENRAVIDEDV